MLSISRSKCVKRAVFCILQDYLRTDVDALTMNLPKNAFNKKVIKLCDLIQYYSTVLQTKTSLLN